MSSAAFGLAGLVLGLLPSQILALRIGMVWYLRAYGAAKYGDDRRGIDTGLGKFTSIVSFCGLVAASVSKDRSRWLKPNDRSFIASASMMT